MAEREPDDFVPCGPVPERLLLDHHRRWAAALVSSSPQGLSASPAVTVASGNLMRGVDRGLMTVATSLEGRVFFLLFCGGFC